MNKFLDIQHPFFAPQWRRVVTVVACLLWAVVELSWGNTLWAGFFAAIGLYCGYEFFVVFDPKNYRPRDKGQDSDPAP